MFKIIILFFNFLFLNYTTYGSDKIIEQNLKASLIELNSAKKHISIDSFYANEIKIQILENIEKINLHCQNAEESQTLREQKAGSLTLTFICHEKNDYQSSLVQMQNVFTENDLVHTYSVTLNLKGEIIAMMNSEINLNNDEKESSTAFYKNKDVSEISDTIGVVALDILYAGFGYRAVSQYAENLFPGEEDKHMHMLTGKMTSDFFTAIAYSTIETNRRDPWRSKLVGFATIALIAIAKESVNDYYFGRGHPEVRDAVASSLGGLMTHFEFKF
jgi:hypothetical protein